MTKLLTHGHFHVGAPGAHRQPAPLGQRAAHLACGRGPVGEELHALLADHHVEPLVVAQRRGGGVALTPVDPGALPSRHREHGRAQVHADDLARVAQPLLREARDDAGAAGDVEEAIAGAKGDLHEHVLGPGAEERPDQGPLVHLRKAQLRERNGHKGSLVASVSKIPL
jgi:hypothetical protein